MLQRRIAIGTAVLFGLLGVMAATAPVVHAADDAQVAAAIESLRKSVEQQLDATKVGSSPAVMRIRQVQHTYLQSTRQYPPFIEVGIGVWDAIYDWHVRYQQPLDARRLDDGRYAMTFMFTTLILRADQASDYVGPPLDFDPRR
jgi:hypothetical protein